MDLEKYRKMFSHAYQGDGYTRQELKFRVKSTPNNPPYSKQYAHDLEKRIKGMEADDEMPGIAHKRKGPFFGVIIEAIKSGGHQDMAGRAYDSIASPQMTEPITDQLPEGRKKFKRPGS